MLLSSYLDSWWSHELSRFILDQALQQWLTGRKRGEDGNTKIWKSWEWKEFFRWNKNIFHSFWRAIIWWKIKICQKIVDTSFKDWYTILQRLFKDLCCFFIVMTKIKIFIYKSFQNLQPSGFNLETFGFVNQHPITAC